METRSKIRGLLEILWQSLTFLAFPMCPHTCRTWITINACIFIQKQRIPVIMKNQSVSPKRREKFYRAKQPKKDNRGDIKTDSSEKKFSLFSYLTSIMQKLTYVIQSIFTLFIHWLRHYLHYTDSISSTEKRREKSPGFEDISLYFSTNKKKGNILLDQESPACDNFFYQLLGRFITFGKPVNERIE